MAAESIQEHLRSKIPTRHDRRSFCFDTVLTEQLDDVLGPLHYFVYAPN